MKSYEAKKMIKNVFENSFNKEEFVYFIKNLLKNIEEKPFVYRDKYIPESFNFYINKLEHIEKKHKKTIISFITHL